MTLRRNAKRDPRRGSFPKKSFTSRQLNHQTLEKRELLAAEIISGPRLVSVEANTGSQFDLAQNNVLPVAPAEITFRFDGSSQLDPDTLDGIQFIAAGGDSTFGNENDVPIIPGFLGFQSDDQGQRVVTARFAETLPDDQYRIQISGFDDLNASITALRNADGDPLSPLNPADPSRPATSISFEVEVGPQVVAVVPQPVTGLGVNRSVGLNQIHVFFNDDPLSSPTAGVVNNFSNPSLSVVNPSFYKLILTDDTVENTDDTVFEPNLIEYDPVLNRATLTFSSTSDGTVITDLSSLPGTVDGAGTFRLRVGRGDALPLAPDPGERYRITGYVC